MFHDDTCPALASRARRRPGNGCLRLAALRPRPRRRCGRGRRHPPRGSRCDGVVPGLRQAQCTRMALGQCRARRGARTAGRPTTTIYRAPPGSCWRTLMLGCGARRPPMRPRSTSHLGEGDAPPVAARAASAGRARKPPAPIPFVRESMREFSRLMNLQGVQQHVFDNHRRQVDAGENAQNPIDSNARSRPGSSS